jgi:hypothetical protein
MGAGGRMHVRWQSGGGVCVWVRVRVQERSEGKKGMCSGQQYTGGDGNVYRAGMCASL